MISLDVGYSLAMMLSDVCLSDVCLSRTSGVSACICSSALLIAEVENREA